MSEPGGANGGGDARDRSAERTARLKQILREQQELKLAEAAVARGLLTRVQLDEAIEAQATREQAAREDEGAGAGPLEASSLEATSLEAILVARGFVTPEALVVVREAMGREDFERRAAPSAAELPPAVAEAARLPGRALGPDFVLLDLLGQGGAGQVWKAWDRRLARFVAVKLPAVPLHTRVVRERFHREALASARVDHPNIVPIFQTGEHEGRPYLVMPFIEGQTLDRVELPLARALEVVQTAALAVAHAHDKGLVHRDLKPGNLMIDTAGRVLVLDFGLVYLLSDEATGAQGLTAPGDVFGTAAYMAPEQARGSPLARTPTTDVYALGATLYHLVTGRPPFAGDSFEAIATQVLERDPAPADEVNPALPHDVATVIQKAMDKDPARRYPSAHELAEELRRLLGDEPIAARSVGTVERLWRRSRRWRATMLGASGGLALLAVVVLVAQARLAGERATALESLRQMARSSLDVALRLRRAGDVVGMRKMLPQLEHAYDEARRRAPELAELDYLMGRMHRALMDEGRALALTQQALAKDPRYAPALYERAILLSRQCGREVDRALGWSRAVGGRAARARGAAPGVEEATRRNPEVGHLREAILRDLGTLDRAAGDSGLGRAAARAARGIFAYHEGRAADAIVELKAAVELDPDMEEAWETLAAAEEAHGSVDTADAIYGKAIAHDRGYAPLRVGRCRARISRDARHAAGEEDATTAIRLMPNLTEAWLCRGMVRVFRAYGAFQTGGAPLPILATAEQDFERAIELDPQSWGARWGRASVRRYRAVVRLRAGEDIEADLAAARADVDRARSLADGEAQVWALGARVQLTAAAAIARRGEAPEALVTAALADLDRAARLAPELAELREWRAEAHTLLAAWRRDHAEDPRPALRLAQAELDSLVANVRGSRSAWLARGRVRVALGAAAHAHGEDPRPFWGGAEHDLDRAVERRREFSDGWLARAALWIERAAAARSPRDRKDAADAASADLERALAIDRSLPEAKVELDRLRALCDRPAAGCAAEKGPTAPRPAR
jgi:serine/threonine-protein kinase